MTEQELFPLVSLKVDQMAVLTIKDAFNDKLAHKVETLIRERCLRYNYTVRIQKYLAKLYVIRVA